MTDRKPPAPPTQLSEASQRSIAEARATLATAGGRLTVLPEPPAVTQLDPWQHRSDHMKCGTCMWYAPKQDDVGRCRRHAPTMNGYPVVIASKDWCGDHKLNERTQAA